MVSSHHAQRHSRDHILFKWPNNSEEAIPPSILYILPQLLWTRRAEKGERSHKTKHTSKNTNVYKNLVWPTQRMSVTQISADNLKSMQPSHLNWKWKPKQILIVIKHTSLMGSKIRRFLSRGIKLLMSRICSKPPNVQNLLQTPPGTHKFCPLKDKEDGSKFLVPSELL